MNPEEHHLLQWLRTHHNPAVLAFVGLDLREGGGEVVTDTPENLPGDGYTAWVTRRAVSVARPLETTPFNFARFINEGSFRESFERIGTVYMLHAYPEDGRRRARLSQVWSPTAWCGLETLVAEYSPEHDLKIIRTLVEELQSAQIKEVSCVTGLYAFSCAAGRQYWRQAELVAAKVDPAMRKTLRGFVVRNQLSNREALAPQFRKTLAKILGHGEST